MGRDPDPKKGPDPKAATTKAADAAPFEATPGGKDRAREGDGTARDPNEAGRKGKRGKRRHEAARAGRAEAPKGVAAAAGSPAEEPASLDEEREGDETATASSETEREAKGRTAAEPSGDEESADEEAASDGEKAPVDASDADDADAGDAREGAPASGRASGASVATAARKGAAWGEPIARFEARWTWLESRLIVFVLVWQLLALVAWVLLNGLAAPPSADNNAGTVFRGVVGGVGLAVLGWYASGKAGASENARRAATIAGLAIGAAIAPMWRAVGVDYFDNVKGWLQEGSTLTLMGGLRGLATRLTLWLAFLGASLATSAGKHIHIDVIFRFLPKKLRLPAALANYAAAVIMCLAGVWGFFDHIAIESYGSKADDPVGAKIENAVHHMGEHAFLTRKQIGLDLRSMPRVLSGERYDQWMSAPAWNAWVKDAGFPERYPKEQVDGILVPDDSGPHVPLVISPDGTPARGILVHDLSLVVPFGLFVIALRFLLRALLSASGHLSVDPDEAHKEEIGHEGPPAEAEPKASAGGA